MVICRELRDEDTSQVIELLARGFSQDRRFPDHAARLAYWTRAMRRMAMRLPPRGLPQYGYCLDADGHLVGVLLLIFADINGIVRCNTSSWYVEPTFRVHAPILARRAINHQDVTYFNVSPAPHTWTLLEAQGYASYANGRFIAVPGLCRGDGARVRSYTADLRCGTDLSQSEVDLLRFHAAIDCISLTCERNGVRYPFVFAPHVRGHALPLVRLVYCRDLDSLVRFAGAFGRYLLRQGYPLVVMDAEAPIRGLPGYYKAGSRRYWKGPVPMRLGDLAYSEIVMFGRDRVGRGTAQAVYPNSAGTPARA